MPDITIAQFSVNAEALDYDLRAEFGVQYNGISTGPYGVIVHLNDDVAQEQIERARQIVQNHDPSVLTAEQLAVIRQTEVKTNSRTQALAIPNWATWTEEQVLDWIDAHTGELQVEAITSLAMAKEVLLNMSRQMRALSRMIVALRNSTWPDLETEV